MTPEQFCYWLQGLMEVQNPKRLSAEQTKMVKAHLQLVFHNVTRDFSRTESVSDPGPLLEKDLRELAEKIIRESQEKPKDKRTLKERLGFQPHLRLAEHPIVDPFSRTYC